MNTKIKATKVNVLNVLSNLGIDVSTSIIKNNLRASGLITNRKSTNSMLKELLTEGKVSVKVNGLVNKYTIISAGDVLLGSYTKKSGKVITAIPLGEHNVGDIEVSSLLSNAKMYFTNDVTKDEARYAFAKIAGVEYTKVKAKVIA